ncbi:hypothetical protein [Streptomyces mirabilis]|uniref:hypothetical protein n=1 Tax=Streptomyces mirabilis TaxID=68239 RepID=UPI003691C033
MDPGIKNLLGGLIGLLIAVLLGALAGVVQIGSVGNHGDYVEEIEQARHQLFQGELTYSDVSSLDLVAGGDPRPFRVDIAGSWHRAKTGVEQSPVSAGAQIGVRLHCSGSGVRCTPLSSERQSVLTKSDTATWMWDVSAQRSGKVAIAITVTAYYGGSNTVLVEKPAMWSLVDVAAPSGGDSGWLSWMKNLWQWVTDVVTSLGGLAVSVTAIVALTFMVRRENPSADANDGGSIQRDSGANRRLRRRPTHESRSVPDRPRLQPVTTRSPRLGRRRAPSREPRD